MCLSVFVANSASAQPLIQLVPVQIDNMPALHSGVVCSYNGRWLFIGGRSNGLHGFQGANLFGSSTQNRSVYVVDPQTKQIWSASTNTLSTAIREHISSSNMEWVVRDTVLYIFGGYGYSADDDEFYTWPRITAVRVDSLIDAVINKQDIVPLFRTALNNSAAVCGSHAMVNDDGSVVLAFGHRFDGTYNKDTIGAFKQVYTCDVRRFKLDATRLESSDEQRDVDSVAYRRRDYNLIPHYDGIGSFAVGYSGVFRRVINRPFTNAIEIRNGKGSIVSGFDQLFAHYDCAVVPVWDEQTDAQYDYFIGGMAENYYNTTHQVVHDTLVPFVKTISCVLRDASGTYSETALDTTLNFMGSNATFIPNDSALIPGTQGVVRLQANALNDLGYIVGGINSPQPHVSTTNPGLTMASNAVYRVLIDTRELSVANPPSDDAVLNVYQSSTDGTLSVDVYSRSVQRVSLQLYSIQGQTLGRASTVELHPEWNQLQFPTPNLSTGVYLLRLDAPKLHRSAKVVIER